MLGCWLSLSVRFLPISRLRIIFSITTVALRSLHLFLALSLVASAAQPSSTHHNPRSLESGFILQPSSHRAGQLAFVLPAFLPIPRLPTLPSPPPLPQRRIRLVRVTNRLAALTIAALPLPTPSYSYLPPLRPREASCSYLLASFFRRYRPPSTPNSTSLLFHTAPGKLDWRKKQMEWPVWLRPGDTIRTDFRKTAKR